MNQHDLVKQATEILSTYADIQTRPMKYAHDDELQWKKYDFPRLAAILDELHILTDPRLAEDIETQEGQLELEYEHREVMV